MADQTPEQALAELMDAVMDAQTRTRLSVAVSLAESMTTLADRLADSLGQALASLERRAGKDPLLDDLMREARSALLTWKQIEARVNEVLRVLGE